MFNNLILIKMKSKDFIPNADGKFNTYQGNFLTLVIANLIAWVILPAASTALAVFQTDWNSKWAIAQNRASRTPEDTKAKNVSKKAYIKAIRAFVKTWITGNALITDPQRLALGVNILKLTRTPMPVPIAQPILEIDETVHTIHKVSFRQASDVQSKGKPDGVASCEIRVQVGGVLPVDPEICPIDYIRGKAFSITYDATQVGLTVYYFARWINTRGVPGPWTLVAIAIIR
jgi:hypothetical protein